MITIGIIICDKDYTNCNKIIKQIKERVKVEYEIIIVDNREVYADKELSFVPTFKFGYNAYQMAGRLKIIELAKGDYIWFIDGDDEVLGITEFNPNDADMIVYNYISKGIKLRQKEKIIDTNLFNSDTLFEVQQQMWNKIIKKSVFNDIDTIISYNDKAIIMEDTIFVIYALKNSKKIQFKTEYIYEHFEGLSDCSEIKDDAMIKTLLTGFENTLSKIHKLCNEKMASEIIDRAYNYLLHFLSVCVNDTVTLGLFKLLMQKIPIEKIQKDYITQICYMFKTKECFRLVTDYIKETTGEDFSKQKVIQKVTIWNDEKLSFEEVDFENEIAFIP